MRKRFYVFVACFMLMSLFITPVCSVSPFESYRYDYWDTALPMPNGYEAVALYTAEQMEIDSLGGQTASLKDLNDPSDMFCAQDGSFYIADTGNNRIIKLNNSLICTGEFKTFTLESGEKTELSSPSGVFVDSDGLMYIADTGNCRVLISEQDGKVVEQVVKPDSDIFPDGVEFAATKVLKDSRGVLYVLVDGLYYGAASFGRDYEFISFYGANQVKLSASQLVQVAWRKIFPRESMKYQSNYVPLELSNMCVDNEDFIYTCTSTKNISEKIRKLNTLGINILNETEFGDVQASYSSGGIQDTSFVDLTVDSNGFINALDYTRGRIFQYDEDGKLIFVFGGIGDQVGLFRMPVAIENYGDRIYVLDKQKKSITVFAPNALAEKTHYAISLYNKGMYEEAIEPWNEVLRTDTGNTFAYMSMGKTYYAEEKYELAMENYRLGQDREGFSKAYREYRTQLIRRYFPIIGIGFIMILLVTVCYVRRRSLAPVLALVGIRVKEEPEIKPMVGGRYIGYILRHPVEGYDEMKFHKGGRLSVAFGIVALWFLLSVIQYTSSGFIFNSNKPGQINVGINLLSTVCIVILWVAANWCVCTLLDGEGRLREIFIHSVYALVPYVASLALSIILSNVLTLDEGTFITWFTMFGFLWSAILLYCAMMTLHNYSGTKTFVCILLTLAAMVIITFLIVLAFTLVQQIISFVVTIWREISFRLY